jgi:hypothetical protein
MSAQFGCLTLAGAASLVALCTGAEATTCSYQNVHGVTIEIEGSSTTTVEGQSACTVDMSSYAALCPIGAGIMSTGYAICEESYAQAMHDAAAFFLTSANSTQTYIVTIAPGDYDYSSENWLLQGQKGALDVSYITPAGLGCIQNTTYVGDYALSGSGCLVIQGAGSTSTTLVSGSAIPQVYGRNASHVMIEGLTFIQPDRTETQGTIVAAPNGVGTTTVDGDTFATLTLDIAPGYPTPAALFAYDCANYTLQPHNRNGCTNSATAPFTKGSIYFRAYDNAVPQEPVASSSTDRASGKNNEQVAWGFPSQTGGPQLAHVKPVQLSNTSTWTLALTAPLSRQVVPDAVQDNANLVCLKVDGPGSFGFFGGTDLIFAGVTWVGGTRGVFRGVRGAASGFPAGAQVYDSQLQPNVIGGTLACLSQSGGLQFGQPGDPPIYGNVVRGLTATSTADDSVAMFNDIGTGVTQSVIEQSSITGSNARFILLTEDPSRILTTNPDCPGIGTATGQTEPHSKPATLLPCASPVLVDYFTRQHIMGCDPLVTPSQVNPSASQCPVYYLP